MRSFVPVCMSVRHKDVAVSADYDVGGRTERVGALSCHERLPQFQEHFAFPIELRDLLTNIAARPSPIHRQGVSDPDVPVVIDVYAVGEGKHPLAEAAQELAALVVMEDGIEIRRANAGVGTASIDNPDGAVRRVGVDPGRRTPFPPIRDWEHLPDPGIRKVVGGFPPPHHGRVSVLRGQSHRPGCDCDSHDKKPFHSCLQHRILRS